MKTVSLVKIEDFIFGWDHSTKIEFSYNKFENSIRFADTPITRKEFINGICLPYKFLGEFKVGEVNPVEIGEIV